MMMKKRMPMALLMMAVLTACDSRTVDSFKEERAHRAYQAAMDDLSAGRLDEALTGFAKTIRADPGNASAHFQLACLLQDRKHDFIGAMGEYRAYLLLAPDSEKATMAKDRLFRCEQTYKEHFIQENATKISADLTMEKKQLVQSLEESRAAVAGLKADLRTAQESLEREKKENVRLRTIIKGLETEEEAPKMGLVDARQLLEEEDEPLSPEPFSEAQRLAAEAEAEERDAGSHAALLAGQKKPSAMVAVTNAAPKAAQKTLPPHPETYVVQNGDTLYKIANRFYGRTAAWKAIRDANKELISTDGRVRAGQTIRLP